MSNDRFIRRREVEERVRLSRSTLYKMIAEGKFPAPHRLGKRAVRFLESDVVAWMNSRPTSFSRECRHG